MPTNTPAIESAGLATGFWLTTPDQTALLRQQTDRLEFTGQESTYPTIQVDAAQTYQAVEGFGFSLTGGSAYLLNRLQPTVRETLLREIFSPEDDGIGVSYLRLSLGASDLSAEPYSYDDLPAGETDPDLAHFNLFAGDIDVIPVMLQILAVNPALKIMASPWSAPRWMKTNAGFVGGSLMPEYQNSYAQYFVRYIQTLASYGIIIHAVTPQNEPLNYKNEPSMVMPPEQQADFMKHHLGPALHAAGLETEIFCWDHNCDKPDYALHVLGDSQAREFVAGSAWHLYGGDIGTLSAIHAAHPDKRLYFTEQWVGKDGNFGGDLGWHGRHVLIGAMRNWSSLVLEWNLASDPDNGPHTPGGEPNCVGALTIGETIERNVAYYVIGHAAKFVRPGSVRIASTQEGSLYNVAFKTPAGTIVVIVLNGGETYQEFAIQFAGRTTSSALPPGALGTYVWQPD